MAIVNVPAPFTVVPEKTSLGMLLETVRGPKSTLEQLEKSVKLPTGITYGELKKSPDWDALRGDSRFQKLVASLAPKDTSSK